MGNSKTKTPSSPKDKNLTKELLDPYFSTLGIESEGHSKTIKPKIKISKEKIKKETFSKDVNHNNSIYSEKITAKAKNIEKKSRGDLSSSDPFITGY